MASRHLRRVASRLKFLVGTIVQRELRDPRLGFVTVLEVEPTEDYKEAKVRVSVLGSPGEVSRTLHALRDARGYIQRRVGENLRLRRTPTLRFVLDEGRDRVERLERLIEETRRPPEAEPSGAEGPGSDEAEGEHPADDGPSPPAEDEAPPETYGP